MHEYVLFLGARFCELHVVAPIRSRLFHMAGSVSTRAFFGVARKHESMVLALWGEDWGNRYSNARVKAPLLSS